MKRRKEAEKPVFQKHVSYWNLLDGRGEVGEGGSLKETCRPCFPWAQNAICNKSEYQVSGTHTHIPYHIALQPARAP